MIAKMYTLLPIYLRLVQIYKEVAIKDARWNSIKQKKPTCSSFTWYGQYPHDLMWFSWLNSSFNPFYAITVHKFDSQIV